MKKCIMIVIALLYSFLNVNMLFASIAGYYNQADLQGTWHVKQLMAGTQNAWFYATATIDSVGNVSPASCNSNLSGTTCPTDPMVLTIDSSGVITQTINGTPTDAHLSMALNKTFIAGTTTPPVPNGYQLIIAQKVVPGTTYSAADVQNKLGVYHTLRVGKNDTWIHGEGYTDATGLLYLSEISALGTNDHPVANTGVTLSVDANGIVTAPGITNYHGFLSADKKTLVATFGDSTEGVSLMITQATTGRTYPVGTIPIPAGTAVSHLLGSGGLDFWAHDTQTVNSSGEITYSNWVASPAYVPGPATTHHAHINASGVVTVDEIPTYHGQASSDGEFIVGTQTAGPGTYALNVGTRMTPWSKPLSWYSKNDFNTDGISDLIKRNNSTGQTTIWYMKADGTRDSYKIIFTDPNSTIVGTGDFNGDGICDLIKRNNSTGQMVIWYMNADGTRDSYKTIFTDPNSTVVGTGDFNGDGICDLIKRNNSTGQTVIWYMKADETRDSYKTIFTDPNSTVVGTGDFNGDGICDLIKRNNSTGQTVIWYMKADETRDSYKTIFTDPNSTVVGTGDFNGDGICDLIKRNNSTGQMVIWYMNADGTRDSYKTIFTDPNSTVVGTGDFNGDGICDLIKRNNSTGQTVIWYMKADETRDSYKTIFTDPNSTVVP